MRIIVTHHSPDLDAIASVWLLRRFLSGWEEARVKFVPAGERLGKLKDTVEQINGDEIIHVDTGLGALDHHQIPREDISAASLTWEYIKKAQNSIRQLTDKTQSSESERLRDKMGAIERIVEVVVEIDHFKECLWPDPTADHHEFSLLGILEGLREQFPGKEKYQVDFISKCLDVLLHHFENRIWAEKEFKKGIGFRVKGEEGIAFETINDAVLPLAQKAGFSVVLRKDPRKGYVRIKVRPDKDFDLTPVYQRLKELDAGASWFLHLSKKMLLNGTAKNPKMKATKLTLGEIIEVLQKN